MGGDKADKGEAPASAAEPASAEPVSAAKDANLGGADAGSGSKSTPQAAETRKRARDAGELSPAEKARRIAAKLAESCSAAAVPAVEIRKKVYVPRAEGVDLVKLLKGSDGAGLAKIEERSGASVALRGRGSGHDGGDDAAEDLHVLITAARDEAARKAEQLVRDVLFDPAHASKIQQRQTTSGDGGPGATIDDPNIFTRDIRVSREVVALVIGSGGENLREIKDKCGSNIKVHDPEDMSEPYRTIHIRGSEPCVRESEALVRKLIAEKTEAHHEKNGRGGGGFGGAGGNTFTVEVPSSSARMVIGPGGSTVRGIEGRHGVRIDVPSQGDPRNPAVTCVTIRAPSEEVFARAKEEVLAAARPGVRGTGSPSAPSGAVVVEVIQVSDSNIGHVIGTRGETVKGIERNSGCSVQVQPREPGLQMRTVQLRGSAEQVRLAREEIEAVLSGNHPSRYGYGGGGGGGGGGGAAGMAAYGQPAYAQAYGAYAQQAQWQQPYYQQQQWQQQHWQQQQQQQQQQYQQAGQVQGKYTREQWKQWKAYYSQFPGHADSMPDEPPAHLLADSEK